MAFISSTSATAFMVLTFIGIVLASPNSYSYANKAQQEAEIIALEQSGFIVPVQNFVQKIMRDLKTIRSQYKEVQGLTFKRKWVPGQVISTRSPTYQQIKQIDNSVYGPLEDVQEFNYGTLLKFSKPYHPEVLSQRLRELFNVYASPNTNVPNNGNAKITYRNNVYLIEKDPAQFSYPGYSSRYAWEFQANQNGNVKLMRTLVPGSKM